SGLLRKTIPFPDQCLSFRTAAVFHNSISSFRFLQFGIIPEFHSSGSPHAKTEAIISAKTES
ncbi:hypothetical protein, partial [Arthrobacter luteolus]|uniref:hypothetical protein n=1 Tax=Arthrobacter luteolus TaxID=98672 RepID=UPI0019606F73